MRSHQKKYADAGDRQSTASTAHHFVFQSTDDLAVDHYQCPAAVAAAAVTPSPPPFVRHSPPPPSSSGEPIYQSTSLSSTAASAAAADDSDVSDDPAVSGEYDACGTPAGDSRAVRVSEAEVEQIHTFFASYKTQVTVCPALANLYLSDRGGDTSSWQLQYTGVPVLLADGGGARSRAGRRLQLVLAERGTGFVLWRDVLEQSSDYRAASPDIDASDIGGGPTCFHTLRLSEERQRLAGLSFDDSAAAGEFRTAVEQALRDDAAAAAAAAGKKRGRSDRRRSTPRKLDISTPCCFQHVTGVSGADVGDIFSVQSLVSQKR